jgi:hypothetical protein
MFSPRAIFSPKNFDQSVNVWTMFFFVVSMKAKEKQNMYRCNNSMMRFIRNVGLVRLRGCMLIRSCYLDQTCSLTLDTIATSWYQKSTVSRNLGIVNAPIELWDLNHALRYLLSSSDLMNSASKRDLDTNGIRMWRQTPSVGSICEYRSG